MKKLKIVHISDNHEYGPDTLPKTDLLIHTGDYEFTKHIDSNGGDKYGEDTKNGNGKALYNLRSGFEKQSKNFKQMIFVPGNHDGLSFFDQEKFKKELSHIKNLKILINENFEYEGGKIHGNSLQPVFHNGAYNMEDEQRKVEYEKIDEDIDILLTHCPVYIEHKEHIKHIGDSVLANRVRNFKNLKLIASGHIHENYGLIEQEGIVYSNASLVNEDYKMANDTIVIELDKR